MLGFVGLACHPRGPPHTLGSGIKRGGKMSRLIIGHVADTSARIWVRGTSTHTVAHLQVTAADGTSVDPKPIDLEARHFFTGVVEVKGLKPDQAYECQVSFQGGEDSLQRFVPKYARGSFRTTADGDTMGSFSFILLSCNLHSLGIVTSPDAAYEKLSALAEDAKARFAIHAGDQIYYDVPHWGRDPRVDDYRRTYLDAWDDCEPAARFLTQLPHYMILDDHEIIDNFANDYELSSGSPPYLQLALANKVYREFQHIHNPQTFGSGPLYYTFDVGRASFFVLDTRTERYGEPPGNQMISQEQFRRLDGWLKKNRERQLFIVTSVPFVTHVRNEDDKWSSPSYRWQREKVLELIWKHETERICFLTGDMHNSYHATMTLTGNTEEGPKELVVHELMSSPVNQLGKNRIDRYDQGLEKPINQKLPFKYATKLLTGEFYTGHSNAMVVNVFKTKVSYEVHRTKKSKIKAEMAGGFSF
jgi:phosphodiesterase/alkaline phosphatase D-like protein